MTTKPKTRTSAERYNARMGRIYDNCKRIEAERIARGEEPNPNLTDVTPQVIRSLNRPQARGYFIAIHGFTPFYGDKATAKPFPGHASALAYARRELFTDEQAFCIEPA